MPRSRTLPCPSALGFAALSLLVFGACTADNTTEPGDGGALQIVQASLAQNPYNALSNILTFTVTNADSARVVYSTPSDTTAETPTVPLERINRNTEAGRIAVLGLLASSTYNEVLQVWGPSGMVSKTLAATTPALSPYVQGITLKVSGAFTRGYTLVSPIAYPSSDSAVMLAYDSQGRIRWYRTFAPGTGSAESKQQHNGDFTIAIGASAGYDGAPEWYTEIRPNGEVVDNYGGPRNVFTDPHELWITGAGASKRVHFFTYTGHTLDLSPVGGPTAVETYGHQVTRQTAEGSLHFRWDAWQHYALADWVEPTGVAPPFDFDHPNSLDFDLDSNYIVSFRNLGAIIKLDVRTGATVWQLGGRLNQFTFIGDPLGGPSGQHCVRVLPNGHLLMYDNGIGHHPQLSRAVEYVLDVPHRTATMVWQYQPTPSIFTAIVGSAQRLSNGNTLVGFGYAGQIHEVEPDGTVIAQARFNLHGAPYFYRAWRLASLYRYVAP